MILYIKIPSMSSAFAKLCHLPDFALSIVSTMVQLFYLFFSFPFISSKIEI